MSGRTNFDDNGKGKGKDNDSSVPKLSGSSAVEVNNDPIQEKDEPWYKSFHIRSRYMKPAMTAVYSYFNPPLEKKAQVTVEDKTTQAEHRLDSKKIFLKSIWSAKDYQLQLAYPSVKFDELINKQFTLPKKLKDEERSKELNIRELMNNVECELAKNCHIAGEDIILAFGLTGSGKTSFIKGLLGAIFKDDGKGGIEVVPEASTDIVVAMEKEEKEIKAVKKKSATESSTDTITAYDLSDPEVLRRHPYPFKKPASPKKICDTAGVMDTDRRKRLENTLITLAPLAYAKSVRVVVAYSVDNVNEKKAVALRDTTSALSRFIVEVEKHTNSILTIFNGLPPKNFKHNLFARIDGVLQEDATTSEQKAVLKDMKAKLTPNGSKIMIAPTEKVFIGNKEHTPPLVCMEKIEALEPMDPKLFKAYIEKDNEKDVEVALTSVYAAFTKNMAALKDNVKDADKADNSLSALFLIYENLEEFEYIYSRHLGQYDKANCFDKVKQEIVKFCVALKQQAEEIFDVNKKEMTEGDIKSFSQLRLIYAHLYGFYEYFCPEESNLLEIEKSLMLDIANKYCIDLRARLEMNAQLQKSEFHYSIANNFLANVRQVTTKADEVKADATYRGLSPVTLELNDKKVKARNEKVHDLLPGNLDVLENAVERFKVTVEDLRDKCGSSDPAAIKQVIRNLNFAEKNLNITANKDSTLYFSDTVTDLQDLYHKALDAHDFKCASVMLEKINALSSEVVVDVKSLTDELSANINALIPSESSYTNKKGELELNEKVTKSFIYANRIAKQSDKEAVQEIRKALAKLYEQANAAIKRIVGDENNVNGINEIAAPLKQLVYVLSVNEGGSSTLTTEFGRHCVAITNFVGGFHVRYTTKLNEKSAVLPDALKNYPEMASYLELIESNAWVSELNLLKDNRKGLFDALESRFTGFKTQLIATPLNILNRENIKLVSWMYKEMVVAKNALKDTKVKSEITDALNSGIDDFTAKINAFIEYITDIDDTAFAALTVGEMVELSEYIAHCEKQKVFVKSISETKVTFEGAIVRLTQAKVAKVEALLGKISVWQDAENKIYPDDTDIVEAINEVVAVTALLLELKTKLPGFYASCKEPLDKCKALIADNVKLFNGQFEIALTALLNKEADSGLKFGKMINLAESLSVLDRLLPDGTDVKNTFRALKEENEQAASKEFGEKLVEIVNAVSSGNYAEAVNKANTIVVRQVKQKLFVQVSAIVNNLVKDTDELLNLLKAAKSTSPVFLDKLNNNVTLLQTASNLYAAQLLDNDVLEKRDVVLRKAQVASNRWILNCVEEIEKLIVNFNVNDFITNINQLTVATNLMPVPPQDFDLAIERLNKDFERRVQEVVTTFVQPFLVWEKEKSSLYDVCHELLAAQDSAKSGTTYKDHWSTISRAALESINTACDELESAIDLDRKRAKEVVQTIKKMRAQVANIPAHDVSGLKEAVIARTATTMSKLTSKVSDSTVADSFEVRFEKICELMLENDGLTDVFKGVDLGSLLLPLHAKAQALAESIREMNKSLSLPKRQLEEFVEIHQRAVRFDGRMNAEFKMNSAELRQFVETTIANLNLALTGYQASNDSALLPRILKACNDLKEINLLRQKFDGKNDFHKMLPDDFSTQVSGCFKRLLGILDLNKDVYGKAWNKNNVPKLKISLDFVKDWEVIVNEVDLYISANVAPSIDPTLVSLKDHHDTYNMNHYKQKIVDKIEEMMKRAGMDVTGYLAIAGKSKEESEKHFAALKEASKFIKQCEEIKDYLGEAYVKPFVALAAKYFQDIFGLALSELPVNIKDKDNWDKFNNYLKVLTAFTATCKDDANLEGIMLDKPRGGDPVRAIFAADYITKCLNELIEKDRLVICEHVENGTTKTDENLAFMYGLQRLADSMPDQSNALKNNLTVFLEFLREKNGDTYLELISTELQEGGLTEGQNIIEQQNCFKGLSTALRNEEASKISKRDILEAMRKRKGKEEVVQLDAVELNQLEAAYDEQKEVYDRVVKKFLDKKVDFEALINELKDYIAADPIEHDSDGKVIWNDKITNKIPTIMAYLFALWTLRDADDYYKQGNKDIFLKTPYPAQIFAILSQLGVGRNLKDLENHLAEILTGEGKSIVNAVTAEMLALIGYDVQHACYSKYLSTRDYEAFQDMFKQLGVDKQIKYGTFNTFMEDYLNSGGDLRELVKNIFEGKKVEIKIKKDGREVIILIDEVDVFFSPEFNGKFYSPDLIYNNDNVEKLINAIWDLHRAGDKAALSVMKTSAEFQACIDQFPKWKSLFENEVDKMVAALDKYTIKAENNYKIVDDTLVYEYLDGSDSVDLGYQRLWSYFHEAKVEANISDKVLKANIGINVSCGHFAYSALLDAQDKKAILGVTGSLEKASEPVLDVLVKDYKINDQTFVSSTYGPAQRRVNKNVTIVPRKLLNQTIADGIKLNQQDVEGNVVRPNINVFTRPADLIAYEASEEIKVGNANIGYMTRKSSSTQAERDKEVRDATGVARVTLAELEKIRGNDTVCLNRKINQAGGPHVTLIGLPLDVNDEIQALGRAARRGRPGSASYIECEENIMEDYGLSLAQVHKIRDSGNAYEQLLKLRIDKFARNYNVGKDKIAEAMEGMYKPSMETWEAVQASANTEADYQKAEVLLQKLNQSSTIGEVQESFIDIGIDTTGSMSQSITVVQAVIAETMIEVADTLKVFNIPSAKFAMQISAYTSYSSQDRLLKCSGWQNEPYKLAEFAYTLYASGGHGRESGEAFLKHALYEDKATKLVGIGDVAYSTAYDINVQESRGYMTHHPDKPWLLRVDRKEGETIVETAEELLAQHAAKGRQFFGLFVPDQKYNGPDKDRFMAMPEQAAPGGKAIIFDPRNNKKKACKNLKKVLIENTFKDVAKGNNALFDKLVAQHAKTKHSSRR